MKYQKPLAIVGGLVLLGGLAYWVRQSLIESGGAKTRGVTSTGTAGQAQGEVTRTTPIKLGEVAFVAPLTTLSLLLQSGGRLLQKVGSSVLPVTTDRRQAFNNPDSARAAYTAPIRPEYKPSSYATLKPR